MLSTQLISVLCPSTKFCFGKYPEARLSMLPSRHHHEMRKNGIVSLKTRVISDGYSKCSSPSHPLPSEPPKYLPADDDQVYNSGLGIKNFFEGKNIFITGATGFFGKVLVEKLLRSTPVGKVYILIKAKDKEDALDRLNNEIINSDLFERVREKHGQSFLREKLIPILGNICEPNLGMDSTSMDDVRNDVDIIIQSAASTAFNDRYDLLLDINVIAPERLMRFARSCNNLKLFAHISTAYVNGKTEGVVLEEPLIMMGTDERREQHIGRETFPRLDVDDEINMASKLRSASSDDDVDKNLKRLAQQRAAFLGWHNAYTLTKAMGEMVLDQTRGDVPMVIIRPTIIESSYKEPLAGWIQGFRMCDPIIISYGKGQLPAVSGNPEVILDIIPVDMVANTTIAAMAKRGQGSIDKPQPTVYHVASSVVNPLRLSEFFEYLQEYFSSNPLIETNGIARIKYFDNIDVDFSLYTLEEISRGTEIRHTMSVTSDKRMIRKIQNQCKAKAAYAEQICKMYRFIGFFNARFHAGNTEKLMKEMSREERIEFEVNAESIDWRRYLQDVHIPGLKKHVLNGTLI